MEELCALRSAPRSRLADRRDSVIGPKLRGFALALLACLAATLAFASPASAQSLAFANDGPLTSNTGHAMIEWSAPQDATLIISRNPDFAGARPLYKGHNHSYFLSGLAGGDYYLLLRDGQGRQSQTLQLTVEHQSLARAIWLTIIGAFITLAIVATILRGARP